MRITFVAEAYESLSIQYLSSVLKNSGHPVSLVYDPQLFSDAFCSIPFLNQKFFSEEQFIANIIATKPEIVAFSAMSENYLWCLEIARKVKAAEDIPIIMGGIHPTSCPEHVMAEDCVDLVCVGEGESAIVALADRFNAEKQINAEGITNLYYKEADRVIKNPRGHLTEDLDSLPFPDKHLFINEAPHMAKRYYIMTSRGCPYNCSFCYNSTLKQKKRYIRKRSVENVLAELKWARNNGIDYAYVMFGDDTFVQDKKWLKEFLESYREQIQKPFVCAIHPRAIDWDTLTLLKTSGCTDIEIGIQTLNSDIRRKVLRRPESNQEIFKAMQLIRKADIRLLIDHIGGIPGETLADYETAVLTYKKYNPNYTAFFWLAYYPETTIIETAVQKGVLTTDDRENIYKGRGLDGNGRFDIVKEEYIGFEFLFAMLPILPMAALKFIVRHKLYQRVRNRSVTLMVVLPRLIKSIVDLNFSPFLRHINRYMDLFHYMKKGR